MNDRLNIYEKIGLAVFLILAFVIYSSFSFGSPQRYNSPDEMANAFFAKQVARGGEMSLSIPTTLSSEIIHPRSTIVKNHKILPASFIGLPIYYGSIGRVFGEGALPYLTPLFGAMALWALYSFTCKIFDKPTAWIFTLLTAVSPAFWYYHSRPFFHNALFFDLVAILIWLAHKIISEKKWWIYILAGSVFGLAIAVRSSEAVWLVPLTLIFIIWQRKSLDFIKLPLFVFASGVAFLPVILTNLKLYGSWWSSGYQSAVTGGAGSGALVGATNLLLPFGFSFKNIIFTLWHYCITLQWWIMIPFGLAIVIFFINWRSMPRLVRGYTLIGLLMTIWLTVYYGSWLFFDNTNMHATIGTSYLRYWLPWLVFSLWPISFLLTRWWSRSFVKLGAVLYIIVFIFFSVQTVIYSKEEGLKAVRQNVWRFDNESSLVRAATPENSVIVSGITDKFFWPERQVIVELSDNDYVAVVGLLKAGVSVYNYRQTLSNESMVRENSNLEQFSLKFENTIVDNGDYSLYEYKVTEL